MSKRISSVLVTLLHHLFDVGFVVVSRSHISNLVAQPHVVGTTVSLRMHIDTI